MYHLHQTDDLERAVLDQRALFNLDPDSPPSLIVVQSAHLQRWLSRILARHQGIWFQPAILTPDAALRELLGHMAVPNGANPSTTPRPLYMDDLKYLSFRTLRRLASQAGFARDWPLLARMLGGPADVSPGADSHPLAGQSEARIQFGRRRLYELADTIAGLFFTYSQMLWSRQRGADTDLHLFQLWNRGERLFATADSQLAEHEEWQARLYGEMFPSGCTYDTLGCLTHRAASEAWTYRGPLQRVVLFGSAFLSVQSFGFFRHLAHGPAGLDIHHILLTPQGDLLPAPLHHWTALIQPFLAAARSCAIGEAPITCSSGFSRPDPLAVRMRFFSCTTRLREVQSLKQNILAEMARLRDSGQPLLPQDIAVMAPDIRIYRPWLEAWFPSRDEQGRAKPDHLSLNLVDLDFGAGSAVIDALERILSLPDGQLERSTVLGLLDNPAVAAAIGIDAAQLTLVREWVDYYGVRRSLNGRHRQRLETGNQDHNTWDRALARLSDEVVRGDLAAGSPELTVIGRVAEFLHRVTGTLGEWSHETRKLGVWVRSLQDFLDAVLKPDDPLEKEVLAQAKAAAGNLIQAALPTGSDDSLDWLSFRLLYQDQLAHLSGSRGQHQIDGITCSSLRPYRAVPFRLIAVLGMNEGEMPRPDPQVSFDLARVAGRSTGFISNPLQDNYSWLETLGSAREQLWVWYNGRDPVADEDLAPSPLVDETRTALAARRQAVPVVEEPVLPFDPAYFRPGAADLGLVNTDPHLLQAARVLQTADSDGDGVAAQTPAQVAFSRLFDSPLTSADRECLAGSDGNGIRIRVKDLEDFLVSPLRVHVRKRLGIYLDEDEDESRLDQEPLDPNAWLGSRLIRQLLDDSAEGAGDSAAIVQAAFNEEMQADRLFPGPVAERSRLQLSTSLARVAAALPPEIASLGSSITQLGTSIDCSFSLMAPFLAGAGGSEEPVKIRLSGELRELLSLENGGSAWLMSGSSDVKSASDIKSAKYHRLSVGMAVLRYLKQPLPKQLIHASTARDAQKPAFSLAILPLEDYELDLIELIQAYLTNLVWPLPFYRSWLKKLETGLNSSTAASPLAPGQAPDPEKSWEEWWSTLADPGDFGNEFGPAEHPLRCPYFNFLSRGVPVTPPWQTRYLETLETVWMPVTRRGRSFIKPSGKKQAAP